MGGKSAQINTELLSLFERLGAMPPAFRINCCQLSTDKEWWLVPLQAITLYRDFHSPSV
jgi:hypothetical protein